MNTYNEPSINKIILKEVDQGILYVTSNGCIEFCNDKAKEIIGLTNTFSKPHAEGVIESGDIVCIASNSLGADNDNLTMKTLEKLGYDDTPPFGTPFIIIGQYLSNKKALTITGSPSDTVLALSTSFGQHSLDVTLNFEHKTIDIVFDHAHYPLNYIVANDHMVILNPECSDIKFYQSKGFTSRHETIEEVLNGRRFSMKNSNSIDQSILGKHLSDILKNNTTYDEVMACAKGEDIQYTGQFKQLNNIPTLCSLSSLVYEGNITGALLKIEDITELYSVISERNLALRKLKTLESQLHSQPQIEQLLPEIIGRSDCIKNIKNQGYRASLSTSTVLLLGESGTGKSFMAYAIHRASNRKEAPFVHVNCSSIPAELLESELFGYEKGSFTGARSDGKKGLFQQAHGGTIFLDEIGEIDYKIQSKLLKVLQDKTFYRIGSTKETLVDARVIAATNKHLESSVKNGDFRQDLFYRINVFPIVLPPLREHTEDIEELTTQLIPKICGRLNMPTKTLTQEAFLKLKEHPFPGNVRELENVLERAINLSIGTAILPEDIVISGKDNSVQSSLFRPLKAYVSETEERILKESLNYYNYDKKQVMTILGLKKTSFYDKVKKYNIDLFEKPESVQNNGN